TIGFATAHTNFGDANLIAHDLAEAYGAQHLWFPCPALLSDEAQVQQTRQLPLVKEAYRMMTQANVTMMGLWSPRTEDEMVLQGLLLRERREAIESYQPVADINHWIFDANGRCINELLEPPPYFLSGLEIPRLKEIILQSRVTVNLVAGSVSYYGHTLRPRWKTGG